MNGFKSIQLSDEEIEVLKKALAHLQSAAPVRSTQIDRLLLRLGADASPEITIGVYGGVVQWLQGSPFPIRIIDYDGDGDDLPDTDDEGHPCSIWIEPPDLPATTAP